MKKKAAVKKVKAKLVVSKVPKPIGVVTHFYGHIKVGIFKFKQPVSIGETVKIIGATTDFEQKIDSMQYDHKDVKRAPKSKEIGIKLKKKVREGDQVFGVS